MLRRESERGNNQPLEELGVAPGFQPFLQERRCSMPRNIPYTSVTLSPPAAQPCPEPLQRLETPLLLREHSQPQNKAFLPERKRNRGERSKRKGRRGRGTKGRGSCAPALPELCSPGNSFLLMTAPISVGSRELVPVESWGGREAFTHLHGWQKPEVLKSLRKALCWYLMCSHEQS